MATGDNSGGGNGGGTGGGNPAPTLSFGASSTNLDEGQTATLTWSSNNATGCEAGGGWGGSQPTSGSTSVGPLSAATTFSLSCSGAGGSILREVRITLAASDPDPGDTMVTVDLTLSDPIVKVGDPLTLDWSSTNATSCVAEGGVWSGDVDLEGQFVVPSVTSDTRFKLTCFGDGSSGVVFNDVKVAGARVIWETPDGNVDETPFEDGLAGYTVYWGTSSGERTYSDSLGAGVTEFEIPSGYSGFFFVSMRTVDGAGNTSGLSNELVLYRD
ncbi:MAG: hypothetical protein AAF513_20275 [Pseudomonadota bacterium]